MDDIKLVLRKIKNVLYSLVYDEFNFIKPVPLLAIILFGTILFIPFCTLCISYVTDKCVENTIESNVENQIIYVVSCHTPISVPTEVNMSCNQLDNSGSQNQIISDEFDEVWIARYVSYDDSKICLYDEDMKETCIINTSCTWFKTKENQYP